MEVENSIALSSQIIWLKMVFEDKYVDTPEQNGVAERKHKHMVETGLSLLFNANLPCDFIPLPHIEDLFDQLQGVVHFSKIDL